MNSDIFQKNDAYNDDDNDLDTELMAEYNALVSTSSTSESFQNEEEELEAELNVLLGVKQSFRESQTIEKENCVIYPNSNLLTLLDSRLQNYEEAEKLARSSSDSSRLRRISRGLKTLSELKDALRSGKAINESEIPPPINTQRTSREKTSEPKKAEETTLISSSSFSSSSFTSTETKEMQLSSSSPKLQRENKNEFRRQQMLELMESQNKEKSKAFLAQGNNDKIKVLASLDTIRKIDAQIKELERGEDERLLGNSLDLETKSKEIFKEENEKDDKKQRQLPSPPSTILEALEQRRKKYDEDAKKASGSKGRRLERVVIQYDEALAALKSGKSFSISHLPIPLGYSPFPSEGEGETNENKEEKESASSLIPSSSSTSASKSSIKDSKTSDLNLIKIKEKTYNEKQTQILITRQSLFKRAALDAKKNGENEMAKEYLKKSLGFKSLIEASQSGLPVDLNTLPLPPQLKVKASLSFEIVSLSNEDVSGSRSEMFAKLESDLVAQIKSVSSNKAHFKSCGDIKSANAFSQMAEHSKKDLDALRFAFKRGDSVPKFHYESRNFSKVICNLDLTDNEVELSILEASNFGSTVRDTYVRYEFPYPKDLPFTDKTTVIKDSSCPVFNYVKVIPLNRKDKLCQRVFKRYSVKMELMAKGGFFRSDSLLGTLNIKLDPLEKNVTLHESFPLMNGRKPTGAIIEVKLRLRHPIVTKQIEQVSEKWLVVSFM